MLVIDIILSLLIIPIVLRSFQTYNSHHKIINMVYLGIITLALVLHIILSGIKITMIFIYISVLIIIFSGLLQLFFSNNKRIINTKVSLLMIILSLLSLVLTCWFMPTFKALPLNGEYQVGQISTQFIDSSRKDPYIKNEVRKLKIKLYYPVQKTEGCKLGNYFDGKPMFSSFGVPAFFGSYLKNVKSNSYVNAPAIESGTKYPLIVFSHGIGSIPEAYTSIVEELASNGYIVASINHTDYSMFSIIDNQNIPFKAKEVNKAMGSKEKENSVEIKYALSIWSSDIEFVINELKREDSEIAKEIDFNSIAIIGHSFGGATAADILSKNSDIKAGINLDGPIYGEALKGISQPFMFIISDRKSISYNKLQKLGADVENVRSIMQHFFNSVEEMSKNSKGDIYKITIKGSSHSSFTDMLLYSPFKYFDGYPARIEPKKALDISKKYIISFLNKYLKGSRTEVNDIQKFDEVEFEH